ncbi:hypothetical protein RJ639_003602 [Escallonia herrerae]|uniref:PB1 domain-containing protein n=1 Tax=Escallonia herrerae TaxID=1293975 RepID=A0AA88W438_9ASTE|nr:hypothetical protein RJ639_003602 [Escallonia herrerae]
MRSLMRSRGAETVLADAPATAPAAKSAASFGTKASKPSGCFNSCDAVGENSRSSLLSTIETQAKPPVFPPPSPLTSHLPRHWPSPAADSNEPLREGSRPGMSRQTKTAPFRLILSGTRNSRQTAPFPPLQWREEEDKANSGSCRGDRERGRQKCFEKTTLNHLPFPTAPSLSRSTPPSPLSSPPSNHSTHSLPPRSNSASPSSPSSRPTSPKALISVTNDDDLAHMMHEYDRLFRTSSKPARLRLFLFPVNPPSPAQSFGSSEDRSDRKRFMEALNSGPVQSPPSPSAVAFAPSGNANFLFGSDKGMQLPFWIG